MSLTTRCPKCDSGFTVTIDLLRLHDGLVRCGQCSHVFDGFECLQDSLPTLTQKVGEQPTAQDRALVEESKPEQYVVPVVPEEPAPPQVFRMSAERRAPAVGDWKWPLESFTASEPDRNAEPPEPSLSSFAPGPTVSMTGRAEPVFKPSMDQPATPEPSSKERVEPAVKILGEARTRGDDPSAFGRTIPEFMEDDEPESPSGVLVWLSGAVVLTVLLIVQLLYVYRDDVASSMPSLRPLLEQVCRPLGCEVGYVRRIERIFVVGSSLQLANNQATATLNQHDYVLRLTLQNRFDRAQPWPSLMVILSDASGTVVIRRAVMPSQYLPPVLLSKPFGAQQEASLEIPLNVQGSPISGFEVEKFFP